MVEGGVEGRCGWGWGELRPPALPPLRRLGWQCRWPRPRRTGWGMWSGRRSGGRGRGLGRRTCGGRCAASARGGVGDRVARRRRGARWGAGGARFVASNRGVPAITVAVGERGAIVAALAEVEGVADLVTLEGVEPYCRMATERLHGAGGVERKSRIERPRLHGRAPGSGGSRDSGHARHLGGARSDGRPPYLEFIHALRRDGAPGATALRGVWGFRGDVAPHGDRVLALRRDVPVIVETVDSAERAERWLELAESLAGEADVVYSQRGLRILTLD